MNASRGIICGTQAKASGIVVVSVEAPLANVGDYSTRLKSMTGGDGVFSMSFSRYGIIPDKAFNTNSIK
jgi:elongation factor G